MSKTHPLTEYARRHKMSMDALAKEAQTSRTTLYRIMAGENATVDLLRRISAATNYEVPVSALIPEVERAAQ